MPKSKPAKDVPAKEVQEKLTNIFNKLQLIEDIHHLSTRTFSIHKDIIIIVDNELDALCLKREAYNGYSLPSDLTFGCISIGNFEFYEGYGHFKYPSEYEENRDFSEELKLISDIKYVLKSNTKLIFFGI